MGVYFSCVPRKVRLRYSFYKIIMISTVHMKKRINLLRFDNRFAKKGGYMSEISLEEARINYEGEWLSAEELARRIEEKMQTGNMKFANLASALEELNKALENSHTIDEKIVISKEDYEKLTAIGGGDERECIRKAIMAFIGEGDLPDSIEVPPIKADFPDNPIPDQARFIEISFSPTI